MEFHRERFPNIPRIYHWNVLRIFHEHIFARWEGLNIKAESIDKKIPDTSNLVTTTAFNIKVGEVEI